MDYKVLFANKELWEDANNSEIIKNKIPLIFSWIPSDVKNIVDIGCGNGMITNALGTKYDITGVDYSEEGLSFVKGPKIRSLSSKIDVPDRSFDMVFTSEMLEHLIDTEMIETIKEFKRISRKYVFITVPNGEFLNQLHIRCNQCQAEFHKYGHVQSFNLDRLNTLMGEDYRLLKTTESGPLHRRYNSILLMIRHKYAQVWARFEKHTVCPVCGNKHQAFKKNLLSMFCDELNNVISGRKPYWLFALYEKRD